MKNGSLLVHIFHPTCYVCVAGGHCGDQALLVLPALTSCIHRLEMLVDAVENSTGAARLDVFDEVLHLVALALFDHDDVGIS